MNSTQREHDFLSFLSLFVHTYDRFDIDFTLLSVLLNKSTISLRRPIGYGGFFSVTVTKGQELLDARPFKGFPMNEATFPKVVALKAPIINGALNDARNRKIWSSMAMELQVLKNDFIRKHNNIVSLFGICWQAVDTNNTSFMPVLVLDAAEMGDLQTFFTKTQTLPVSQRKMLGLAVDVTAGIRALHDVGIIHCDIKPQNILIYKDDRLSFVAKVADFGSSLLLSDVVGEIKLPAGTNMWQAPECEGSIGRDQLVKSDIYSLGLVLLYMLSGGVAMKVFEAQDQDKLDLGGSLMEFKHSGKIAGLAIYILRQFWDMNPDGKDSEEDGGGRLSIGSGLAYLVMQTLDKPSQRISETKMVLTSLRHTLHRVLREGLLRPLQPNRSDSPIQVDMNPQEQDILLDPSLEEPSTEDLERIWRYARWNEMLQRVFNGNPVIPSSNIPQEAAASHIQITLERWRQQNSPKPSRLHTVCDGGAVMEADRSFGTLRTLALVIVKQLAEQLRLVAEDPDEDKKRRGEAGYQFAALILSRVQVPFVDTIPIDQCLQLLHQSALLGHLESRNIVGWLYTSLGREMPFDADVNQECTWLQQGVEQGSATARRRLQFLDIELYKKSLNSLRFNYSGFGAELPHEWRYMDDEDFHATIDNAGARGSVDDMKGLLFCFAVTGRVNAMRRLTNFSHVNVNWPNSWEETPLLMACRAGHLPMALYLLEKGADPSSSSQEGVTPLHFLGAFDDEDIPVIAAELVSHGAPLEARSSSGTKYRLTIDSTFGQLNGTPLTWAVAANSKVATQTLIDIGADPFDLAARNEPVDDRWSTLMHRSPVFYAATVHQYDLLEILLPVSGSGFVEKIRGLFGRGTKYALNNNFRPIGTQGYVDHSSAISDCVRYDAEGFLRRLLLHGDQYENAFRRTFEILVQRGADPLDVDGEMSSALEIASQYGQPFVIDFLMNWNDGRLKPPPIKWLHMTTKVAGLSDVAAFQALMRYEMIDEIEASDWKLYFGTLVTRVDDVQFLEPFREQRDPEEDYSDLFEAALHRAHFNFARWFYDTGKCDLLAHVEDGKSLLGRLLVHSKVYANALPSIEWLLKLPNLPDEMFYNVSNICESKFTALHAAAFYLEYNVDSNMAPSILRAILRKYSEPHQLNYQITEGFQKGQTPLHLAVEAANTLAVSILLEEGDEDLDLTLLNSKQESVVDVALRGLKNQKHDLESWEVPLEKREEADLRHWQHVVDILLKLKENGAKHHKYQAAVCRPEPNDLFIFDMRERVPIVQIDISDLSTRLSGDLWENHPFWSRVMKLNVGSAFWIGNPLSFTASELDVLSAALPGNGISSLAMLPVDLQPDSEQRLRMFKYLEIGCVGLAIV